MDYLQNGVPVKYFDNGEEHSTLVYLIDFKNPSQNDFTVANQWTFIENSEKRPDVILFVNGLPLVIVELKSLSREETDASDAYRQLRNYMYEIPSMFIYNAVCVMSDMTTSKAGTITSGEDRFMEWKTTDGSYENTQYAAFDTFFEGLFEKNRFLDIVKNFICFNVDGQNTSCRLSPIFCGQEGCCINAERYCDGWQGRCILAYTGQRKIVVHGLLCPLSARGFGKSYNCCNHRPK